MNIYEEYKLNDTAHWEWHTTFLGQLMQHNYRLYFILDEVFKIHKFERIVEIGTGHGALTTYLALWGIKQGSKVLTLDFKPEAASEFLKKLGVITITGDEYSDDVRRLMIKFIGDKKTFLICDGGAKQDEFDYWAVRLPSGSVIAAHDLNVEFGEKNINPIALKRVSPILEDRWMEMNSQIAIYELRP